MKKILSFVLICMILTGSFAYAADAENVGITMTSTLLPVLSKCEVAKLRCTIESENSGIGVKMKLYLDGNLIDGAGSDYFELYGTNHENFDFLVPETIDETSAHTLRAVLTTSSGKEVATESLFTVSATPPDIKLAYFSTPLAVYEGTDLYYGVKFYTGTDRAYKLTARCYINGVGRPELDKTYLVYDGAEEYLFIPAAYTYWNGISFNVKVMLNPGCTSGVSSAFVSADVGMHSLFAQQYNAVKAQINPVKIPATVTKTTNAYSYSSLTGYRTTLPSGTALEYLNPDNHESMRAAKVKTSGGAVYWVPMANIYVSRTFNVKKDYLSTTEKEIFVNGSGYSSKTPYLIWINKERQILTVFIGSQNNWKYVNSFPVATGKNLTPTPTVVCEYQYKTNWVTPGYTCNPVLALYDGYAIHNQPKNHSGYVIDSTIGAPASAGCIRMLQEHVNWVYSYVPVHSTVVIY